MISGTKRYFIEIFLKKCTIQSVVKKHMDFVFELLQKTYNISEKDIIILKSEYNFDRYMEKIIPVIDKHFTIEELKEAIKFFSSATGRRMIDNVFLTDINKINSSMDSEIEQKFALIYGKTNK